MEKNGSSNEKGNQDQKTPKLFPLKDVLDQNFYSNQNNEFRNFILPPEEASKASFEKQMDSIIKSLSEELDLEDAKREAEKLEETLMNNEKSKVDIDVNKTKLIKDAIETCFTSSYQMLSDEFHKKLSKNIRNHKYGEAFKMFGEEPKKEYIADNDFIRYLCLGLIDIDTIDKIKVKDLSQDA